MTFKRWHVISEKDINMSAFRPLPNDTPFVPNTRGDILVSRDGQTILSRLDSRLKPYPGYWVSLSIKQNSRSSEYRRVTVLGHRTNVSRLVLLAWTGVPPDSIRVWAAHVNGVINDDQLENLQWEKPGSIIDRRGEHGKTAHGVEHYKNIHSEKIIKAIREASTKGVSQECLALLTGAPQARISEIVNEKTWSPKTAIKRRLARVDKPPSKGGGTCNQSHELGEV
jgi:proteasome lid subunit RPN8/RPN11